MSQKIWLPIIPILIIFFAIGFYKTSIFSLSEGPDEVAHYLFSRFVAENKRLPLDLEERAEAGYKSDWPPLYHLLVGFAGAGIDFSQPPYVKLTQDNPRLQLVVGNENILAWRALTTEDPLRGELLLWHVGRWVALLAGAAGIFLIYLLLRQFFSETIWPALGGTAVLACLPTYLSVSSVVNYESLLGAMLAGYFLLLWELVKNPNKASLYFAAGFLMGLAFLTKPTPLTVLPLMFLLIIWFAYRNKWPLSHTFYRLVLMGVGLILTMGTWVGFSIIYFNEVEESGWIRGLLRPFADQSDETSARFITLLDDGNLSVFTDRQGPSLFDWGIHIFTGMWGNSWLAGLFLGLMILAVVGIIRQWPKMNETSRVWVVLLALHLLAFIVLPLARFVLTRDINTGMGQHILFPSAAALIFLLVFGVNGWLSHMRTGQLFLGVALIGVGQNVVDLVNYPDFTFPLQTVPISQAEAPVAKFNELTLVDQNYNADQSTLNVTLQWRAELLMIEDYQTELTLLDAANVPQAQWVGMSLNGRYVTRAWSPGDYIRDTIALPIVGLPSGTYHLQLRLLGEAGVLPFEILTAQTDVIDADSNALHLGEVQLSPAQLQTDNLLQLEDQQFFYALWPQSKAVNLPLYKEWATVQVVTSDILPEDVQAQLVGPNGQAQMPISRIGRVATFHIQPDWPTGEYQIRFQKGTDDSVVAQVDSEAHLFIETDDRQFEIGPIGSPLAANFADQMTLLGYDLSQRRIAPGQSFDVTLHWQALRSIGADLITFNHLVDKNGNIYGGQDRRPRDVYSTMLWAPQEIISDPFAVQANADAPDGIYNLLIGVYLPVGESYVSLPLVHDGQFSELTHIMIGPFKVGNTLPQFVQAEANPQVKLEQPFGHQDEIMLFGYDQNPMTDGQLPIVLYWRSEVPLPVDYTTFVHIRNQDGETIAQRDQLPLNGAYPTSLWDSGEVIRDEVLIPLPDQISSGDYQIIVGMYDFQTGQRLSVPDNSANEVSLTTVTIP